MLDQWVESVQRLSPVVTTLGENLRNIFDKPETEFSRVSDSLNSVVSALEAAESVRISRDDNYPQTGLAKSGQSPLELLVRGKLGSEVAALIMTLRLHAQELLSGATILADLKTQWRREVRKELASFHQAKSTVLAASQSTSGILRGMREGLVFQSS